MAKKFMGLSEAEVQSSRAAHDDNSLAKRKKISIFKLFLSNFKNCGIFSMTVLWVILVGRFVFMQKGQLQDIIVLGVALWLAIITLTVLAYYDATR